jgi:hypothetical protein
MPDLLLIVGCTQNEYFFPGITTWQRLFAAFALQNFFLAVYGGIRVAYMNHVPTWVSLKKKEPLRFVRDAYRAGCALRERRYRMLVTSPTVSMKLVCKAEDIDEVKSSRRSRAKQALFAGALSALSCST